MARSYSKIRQFWMMRIFELNVSQVNIFIVGMFIIQFINHTLAINIRHFQFFIAKLTVNLLIYQTTLKHFFYHRKEPFNPIFERLLFVGCVFRMFPTIYCIFTMSWWTTVWLMDFIIFFIKSKANDELGLSNKNVI